MFIHRKLKAKFTNFLSFNFKAKIFRIFLICFILIIFFIKFDIPKAQKNDIWFYNNQKINFQGIIVKPVDTRINNIKLTVDAVDNFQGRVLVSTNLYPEYNYGDLLEITCNLKKPEPFEGFAYDRYLAKDKIYSVCYYPKINLISRGQGNFFLEKIYNFKNKLQLTINKNLPEPQASLLSAILLGSKRGIPSELYEQFSLSGTSHLIAISGLHITILSLVLMNLGFYFHLSRKQVFYGLSVILFLYLIIIGFPASAVRAVIMGWLIILAQVCGRQNRSSNALLFAASIMILINPRILRDDIGFQLSFSAVLGLLYLLPLFENLFDRIPNFLGLRENLKVSFVAQIATAPLIIIYFERISLVGPIVNLLVLPILPYLMILGIFALGLSLIFFEISSFLFFPVYLGLTYLIKITELFSQLDFSSLNF